MKKYKRIFTIVPDSLGTVQAGCGFLWRCRNRYTGTHFRPDGDTDDAEFLQKIGMANLHPLKQVAPAEHPMGYYMTLKEASTGKDTMTGHWEMMGLHITKPFQTFTEHGFPKELIEELEKRTGHKVIGNKSASGTESIWTSWQRKRSQPAT